MKQTSEVAQSTAMQSFGAEWNALQGAVHIETGESSMSHKCLMGRYILPMGGSYSKENNIYMMHV